MALALWVLLWLAIQCAAFVVLFEILDRQRRCDPETFEALLDVHTIEIQKVWWELNRLREARGEERIA